MKSRHIVAALTALTVFCQIANAIEIEHPLAPPDTSSPRATLESFVEAMDVAYQWSRQRRRRNAGGPEIDRILERTLGCLDLSQSPEFSRLDVGRQSALCLKEVLDRIELPPAEEIPHLTKEGQLDPEGLPARWRIPQTTIAIARMDEGPRAGEYLFTHETVSQAPDFYERAQHLPYKPGASVGFYETYLTEPRSAFFARLVHRLPAWARQRVFGHTIWQWTGLVLTTMVGLIVMLTAYHLGRTQAKHFHGLHVLRYWFTLAFPAAAVFVPIGVKNFIGDQLAISGGTLQVVDFCANLVFLVSLVFVLIAAGNRVAALLVASPRIHPQGIDAQFIRLSCRVLSLAAAVIVFLEGGQYLGIQLTTLLAGAGVGGIALALAAQDALKNLFGSMMIVLDKPYRVGERIVAKGYDGVVEEIGLRSTKLRLLTGHQTTVPNEEMARCDIENVGRRPHIRRIADIALPLDTPLEKVDQAVSGIRAILEDHEGLNADYPPRVFYNEIGRDSLNVRCIYWYHPPDYWAFMAFGERFNRRLMQELSALGIPFALPSTKTVLSRSADDRHKSHDRTTDESAVPPPDRRTDTGSEIQ